MKFYHLCCGHPSNGRPNPKFGLDVKTNNHTHIKRVWKGLLFTSFWGGQGSPHAGPKMNWLVWLLLFLGCEAGERVPAFRPGFCGLNFPLGQRRRPPTFLISLPRCGTQRGGGVGGHESCQPSNIKNGLNLFITDKWTIILVYKSLWLLNA